MVCYMIGDSCVTGVGGGSGRATRSNCVPGLMDSEEEEGYDQGKGSAGKAC